MKIFDDAEDNGSTLKTLKIYSRLSDSLTKCLKSKFSIIVFKAQFSEKKKLYFPEQDLY